MSNSRTLGGVPVLAAVSLLWIARAAEAQEEVSHVAEVVEVIDAFDEGDPFDFTLRASYGFELTRVKLTQQCPPGQQDGCLPGRAGVLAYRDVARFTQERHLLTLDALFGLYKDLQAYTSWPLILLDRREIKALRDSDVQSVHPDNQYVLRFPFRAKDRSGIDQFALGLSWLPFSQERESPLPTWLLNIEGRFAIGDRLRPSCSSPGGAVPEVTGPGPNNNWFDGDDEIAEDREPCNDKGGISQRTNDLVFRTTLARRFGMLEPYIGFRAQISFPDKEDTSRYGDARNIPVTAETHFGMEIVPWERPQKAQYLTVGIHFWGGWTRETLNYGPLFDVLGTNPNMRFRFDLSETNRQDRDEAGAYSGLTRVEGHGFFGGRLAVTMQAAKYVKFVLDLGLAHVQEHFGTFTDECRVPRVDENPDPPDIPNSCAETGGIFQTDWRPQVDNIGRRFRMEQTTVFSVNTTVNVQF